MSAVIDRAFEVMYLRFCADMVSQCMLDCFDGDVAQAPRNVSTLQAVDQIIDCCCRLTQYSFCSAVLGGDRELRTEMAVLNLSGCCSVCSALFAVHVGELGVMLP